MTTQDRINARTTDLNNLFNIFFQATNKWLQAKDENDKIGEEAYFLLCEKIRKDIAVRSGYFIIEDGVEISV